MTLLEIEMDATTCDLLVTDYTFIFWCFCFNKKNKAKINKLARELNIYPRPVSVYHAVLGYLFEGTAITPYSYQPICA